MEMEPIEEEELTDEEGEENDVEGLMPLDELLEDASDHRPPPRVLPKPAPVKKCCKRKREQEQPSLAPWAFKSVELAPRPNAWAGPPPSEGRSARMKP